jgi:CubicO group peptidase (beta-lactamase class C family)
VVCASCGGSSPTTPSRGTGPAPTAALTPVPSNADWPASTPEAERLDPLRLGDLALRVRRGDYGRINSVLIARHGRLAFEEYFNGWSSEQPHTMQSVTKSVVSLLAGLAAGTGRLSVGDPVTRFFPGYEPIANLDGRKTAMTVRDLLTMRTGCMVGGPCGLRSGASTMPVRLAAVRAGLAHAQLPGTRLGASAVA